MAMGCELMANANLSAAKAAKNDEFYTGLPEIQAELKHYKDKFAGKTVFCNCDDPFESNFVKYFLMNFNSLGLKELIATGYKTSPVQDIELGERGKPYALRVTETTPYLRSTQTDLDIAGAEQFLEKEQDNVMIPVEGNWSRDEAGNILQIVVKEEYMDEKTGKTKKRTVKQDLYYEAGDFRSDMSIELLQQADIIVTNPPFSLFREYVAQLMEYEKKFLIIGSMNAITYKEIFPLLKDNRIWLGYTSPKEFLQADGSVKKFGNILWYTNLDHKKRHEPLDLRGVYYDSEKYPKYDNYDAIEVSKTADIPCDYDGVMGVPITFLDKYCPEQFEIIGMGCGWNGDSELVLKTYSKKQKQYDKNGIVRDVGKLNDGTPLIEIPGLSDKMTCYEADGHYYIRTYGRILIRRSLGTT